ncbi:hypothetical protein GCM10025879_15170 [Leuconostoc litchii]|uniref:DUF1413 domain-containing protein n=1 Tax=Leuconostoc litchii TaxID=1981069 RepID=UPI0023E907F5|nr:DUF1413 domain-containing protein [Leuconostoc litchii]GMA70271.1 hypothetical protein GCM10025879_15170 [Leuconostoc litchii]
MNISQEAVKRVNSVEPGTEFTVKDLFTGIEWYSFLNNQRLSADKVFLDLVESGQVPNVSALGKKSEINTFI